MNVLLQFMSSIVVSSFPVIMRAGTSLMELVSLAIFAFHVGKGQELAPLIPPNVQSGYLCYTCANYHCAEPPSCSVSRCAVITIFILAINSFRAAHLYVHVVISHKHVVLSKCKESVIQIQYPPAPLVIPDSAVMC